MTKRGRMVVMMSSDFSCLFLKKGWNWVKGFSVVAVVVPLAVVVAGIGVVLAVAEEAGVVKDVGKEVVELLYGWVT